MLNANSIKRYNLQGKWVGDKIGRIIKGWRMRERIHVIQGLLEWRRLSKKRRLSQKTSMLIKLWALRKFENIEKKSAISTEMHKKKNLEELIEKRITTSSEPLTLCPVEFNDQPRIWSQFISQFEEFTKEWI